MLNFYRNLLHTNDFVFQMRSYSFITIEIPITRGTKIYTLSPNSSESCKTSEAECNASILPFHFIYQWCPLLSTCYEGCKRNITSFFIFFLRKRSAHASSVSFILVACTNICKDRRPNTHNYLGDKHSCRSVPQCDQSERPEVGVSAILSIP